MISLGNGQIALGDCLEVMRSIPAGSVDMILCDLPYGTTQNKWDSVIPFEPLWSEYWRVCKGAVVLTAAQPFTSALIMSQVNRFRYAMVWDRVNKYTDSLNAKRRPMRRHEDVCVFSKGKSIYNPQKTPSTPYKSRRPYNVNTSSYGKVTKSVDYGTLITEINPCTIIQIEGSFTTGIIHPTQKPVALFEYLIKTYTNEGETVLDNCLGSGTTAIAAENTGRRWIGIEQDPTYFGLACDRIARHVNAN